MHQTAQLNVPIAHTYSKDRLGVDCRAIHHVAVFHTEARPMPGTLDDSILYRPFIQGSSHMTTSVSNCVDRFPLFPQHNWDACSINAGELPLRQVSLAYDRHEIVRATFPGDMIHANAFGEREFPSQVGREERSQIASR